MSEAIILDRFEYKLPKDMFSVSKKSTGFKYKLKHSNVEFDSEDKILKFIDDTLEERKRYLQLLKTLSVKERKRYLKLLKTLSVKELSKLFSDIVLLGLSPKQIKEYEAVEQFVYEIVIADHCCDETVTCEYLYEVKDIVADKIGLQFTGYLDLVSTKDTTVIQGY